MSKDYKLARSFKSSDLLDIESSPLRHLAAGFESQLQVEEVQRLKFHIDNLKDHLEFEMESELLVNVELLSIHLFLSA